MRKAARWISFLLHPVFMPLFTLWLAMLVDPDLVYFIPEQAQRIILMMVTVMTIAFPLTSTLLLLRFNMITDLQMHRREERIVPFTMTIIYFGMTYYMLRRSPVPIHPVLLSAFTGIILAAITTTMITMYWKISAHMVGIGGLLGAIAGLAAEHSLPLLPVIALLILLAGLLGTARSIAGSHVPAQIYSGVALGFAATYSCVVLEVVV